MSANLLVSKERTENLELEFPPHEMEVCFEISDSGDLHLDLQKLGSSTEAYLKYCVVRNPSDLRSHVRRINLHGRTDDGESLYGALIDLLIALDSNGEALRSRLLEQYRNKLSDHQYKVLLRCSEANVSVDQIPFCKTSVLTKGVVGTCLLVKPVVDIEKDEKVRDVLLEAQEYLEYSQIEAARQVLEQALLKYPERKELHAEVLALYRAGRDVENFQKTFDRLNRVGNPLSDDWSAVSEFLVENA